MTVRKDEPMDHLAATDEEFDALLDASSLGAPHVIAETGDIPVTARRRMAQAVRRQRRTLGLPADTSHPRSDDKADSQPEAPAGGAGASQEAQPVNCGILHAAIGAGKSAILAALFAFWHSTYGDASPSSRRQPLARRSWTEPSTDGLQSTLWRTAAFDEADGAGRSREGVAHGDGIFILCERQDAWAELVASMFRCRSIGAPAVPTVMAADLQVTQLLWPDVGMRTSPALRAVSWVREARNPLGLWNLRHLIEPHVQHDQSLGSAVSTGLPMRPTPVTRLLISRFTTCAYTAVGAGLLVPKTDSAPHCRHRFQETSATGRDLAQPVETSMRLRRTLADGVHELSAELPMLFHFDERESLALTSSLPTRLTYRVSDPYAVEARFRAGDRDETVWIFARDLLRNGLEGRSGLGDVVVWPGTGPQGEQRVFVRLSSPEGSALLSAADADLRAFLDAAGSLVAFGAEHSHLLPALNALETTIGELASPGRCD